MVFKIPRAFNNLDTFNQYVLTFQNWSRVMKINEIYNCLLQNKFLFENVH